MGLIWVLSAPDGPHAGPMNLAIRDDIQQFVVGRMRLEKVTERIFPQHNPAVTLDHHNSLGHLANVLCNKARVAIPLSLGDNLVGSYS